MARSAYWLPIQPLSVERRPLGQFLRGLPGRTTVGAPLWPSDPQAVSLFADGLLGESLWSHPLDRSDASQTSPTALPFQRTAPVALQTDDGNTRPDAAVNLFRDSLGDAGLRFLKYGPRSSLERLAFAQQVRPDANL